jgi:hypothetical protein
MLIARRMKGKEKGERGQRGNGEKEDGRTLFRRFSFSPFAHFAFSPPL